MNQREHILNAVIVAVGVGFALKPGGSFATIEQVAAVSIPVLLGALFPDVDVHYGEHRKTLHNIPVIVVIIGYPLSFGNLQWVWLGVITHYILDVIGSTRGIALFYPVWDREFGVKVGVTTSSRWAPLVTVVISVVEILAVIILMTALPETGLTTSEPVAGF